MHTGPELLVLMVAVGGAWLAAAFAALGYFRPKQAPELLTGQGAAQLLRAETDIVRSAVDDQAGRLRQELNQSLKDFQELTVGAFGGLRDGIDGQVSRKLVKQNYKREGSFRAFFPCREFTSRCRLMQAPETSS